MAELGLEILSRNSPMFVRWGGGMAMNLTGWGGMRCNIAVGGVVMRRSISIRLPDELAGELEAVVRQSERSRSFHIRKALEFYLESRVDLQVAKDRFSCGGETEITTDEMSRKLGL